MSFDIDDVLDQRNKTEKCENLQQLNDFLVEDNDLVIFQMNIRSLSKNFDELLILIQSMKKCPDIIVCTETRKIILPQLFNIENFVSYSVDSEINKCDGTCLYISKKLCHQNSVINIGRIKALFTEIVVNTKHISITSLYRSHCIPIDTFTVDLYEHLSHHKNLTNHIILGDINIDILADNIPVNTYINNYYELGYESCINVPTRVDNTRASCIDHVFVKMNNDNFKLKSAVYEASITDHYATILNIGFEQTEMNHKTQYKRQVKINYEKVRELLKTETWNDIYNETDVDIAFEKFIKKIEYFVNLATTVRTKPKNDKRRNSWITKGLVKSCKIKDTLHQKLKKNRDNVELKTKYVTYKNKLKSLIRAAKIKYYNDILVNIGNDTRKLWDFVNSQVKSKRSGKNEIEKVYSEEKNIYIHDKRKIVDEFNNFFANIGPEMAKKFENVPTYDTKNDFTNPHSIFLFPTTETEIIKIILELKSNKAAGIDKLQASLLKRIADLIAKPLKYLINFCIEVETFPNYLKKAEIIPIFKMGDKDKTTNYRPISLISNFAKVFEKILKERIISFVEMHKLIHPNQFGFQSGKSTDHALTKVFDEIHDAISTSTPCIAIFLDLAKAFDTVDHNILLRKLFRMGFRGNAYNLIKSYLSGRKQLVKIDDELSNEQDVKCGVPQGTILGPILFILYLNSIFSLKLNANIYSFADDTVLLIEEKTWDDAIRVANIEINKVMKWLCHNHLSLNTSKTVYITFGSYSNSLPATSSITIHEFFCNVDDQCNCKQIERVNCTKYLGIMVDSNLRWNEHVSNITKKTRYIIYLFYKLKSILSSKQLMTLYYSLFWSIVTYGIIAWGGATNTIIAPIITIQKRIIKIIFNKPASFPSEQLYREQEIIELRKYYIEKSLFTNYQSLQGKFMKIKQKPARQQFLQTPKINKEIDRRNNRYVSVKTFNLLPENLKEKKIDTLKRSRAIRKWIITLNSKEINLLLHPIF